MTGTLAIGVIDDHQLILRGFVSGLQDTLPELGTTYTSADLLGSQDWPDDLDVVLLDLNLGDDSYPPDNVERLTTRGWPVLIHTQGAKPAVVAACLRAGASGIVGKHQDLTMLADAVRCIAGGSPYLNEEWAEAISKDAQWQAPALAPREREALRLYAAGLPMKSVAHRMGISADTAKEYLLRVRKKYAERGRVADTKTDLFCRAVEDGHLPGPELH